MGFINFDAVKEAEIWKGTTARFFHSDNLTFGRVKLRNGALLPEHSHHHEQFTMVLQGRLKFTIGGKTRTLRPGMVAHIPPDTPHSGKALTRCIVLDNFYPVREDFRNLVERRDTGRH